MLDVGEIQDCVSAAEMPTDQFDGKAGSEHHPRGFRVDPHIVFGGRGDIAFATGVAAHHHAAADVRDQGRLLRQREGQVGQGTQGNDDDAGMALDNINDCLHGGLRLADG